MSVVLVVVVFIYLKIHDRRTRRPLILSDTENTAAQWNIKKRENDINVKKKQYKANTVHYSNTIQTEKYEN